MVEPHTGIDRQPFPYRERIARERGSRDELTAAGRRIAGDGLKRLPVVIDEPDTGRNDLGLNVLTLFDLRADLPLVIGGKEPSLVAAQCGLGGRANERQPTDQLRSAAVDPDTRSNRFGVVKSPVLGSSFRV